MMEVVLQLFRFTISENLKNKTKVACFPLTNFYAGSMELMLWGRAIFFQVGKNLVLWIFQKSHLNFLSPWKTLEFYQPLQTMWFDAMLYEVDG